MALVERSREFTVAHVLASRATADPERPYLFHEDATATFGEIEGQAEALAAGLGSLGIEEGDRIAILLPPCPEFVVGVFAAAKLGAVIVPLDPSLSETELHYMLRHSEASAALTIESFRGVDFLQLFEGLFPLLPDLQYLVTVGIEDLWYDDRIFPFGDLISAGTGRDFEGPRIDPEKDLFAIAYTSGTTGKPKGVELTHRNLVYAGSATAKAVGLVPDDRIIGVTALFHVFGLGPGILGTALAGASLVLQSEFDGADALDLVERHRVTVHYGVPTVFATELREQRVRSRDLSSIRKGVVAGAPVGEGLLSRIRDELCPDIRVAYSLTETGSTVSITGPDDGAGTRVATVGRPLPETEVRVLEKDGTQLPLESLGEIAIRGPGVMRGYYRQPRETAGSFDPDGFFLTGDLGMVDDEGYVHLVGRRKEVIIRAGYNVYPREVEDRLHAHPAVREAVVVGIPDELLGEIICAAVVHIEGAIVTEEEVRDWCGTTLADHKVPDRVRFFEELPLTGTGKVRRVELARMLRSELEGGRS